MIITVLIYFIMSTLAIMKLKKSWETIMTTMILSMILLSTKLPMSDYLYMLSDNYMMDSMSIIMVILSMWISSLMIMVSYYMKRKHMPNLFLSMIIMLMITLVLSFSANNLILFYMWFESSLIPILLMIMMWGYQPERKKASLFIMLYTITASMPLLMILLKMFSVNFHSNMSMMYYTMPTMINQHSSLIMTIMAFMIKLPLFSVHLWLPKAHVEAPLAGSMILAAILLKLGGYGLMRMNKMLTYLKLSLIYNLMMSVAMIGAIITNTICIRQTDLKALIAYSSVGHMGLLVIGTLSNSKLGQYGSLIIMMTHGLTSSYLFFLTNMMHEKLNSRNIMMMNGSLIMTPILTLMWLLGSSLNMAIPPSLNIVGEITIMMSLFFMLPIMISMLMITNFLTALYSLYLYSMINHMNQLKMTNMMTQMPSINLTISMSHIWPLLIMTTMPMKLMMWC